MLRESGVLMHISSLSSLYGIGTMGQSAREFVDFLKESGQSYWQLLPICPTSYGDSPYQSYSTFAGNPYFVDLDELEQQGLLEKKDFENVDWGSDEERVDYGILYQNRYPILRKAARKFLESPPSDFQKFCHKNQFWLKDYAQFMALKDLHRGADWKELVQFWEVVQYLFFKQWTALKRYANEQGISIIGDLPIYVSYDSVDVWAHPELFQLDSNRVPKEVAGCPPDGFSEDGQLWGNPLYDWEYMEKTGYEWWIQRIQYLCNVYDVLRIDHFRGFAGYYAIPYGEKTARNGRWCEGPGMKLFRMVERKIGKQKIIAEDLGHITEDVKRLLKESGFPGMKVLQFAFDSRDESGNEYLPQNFEPHCVAYTGTHDNNTILGWFEEAKQEDVACAKQYLKIENEDALNWDMMDALWESSAELTIVTAQDLLDLKGDARMNRPSTLGGNWQWRALPGVFNLELVKKIHKRMERYDRIKEKGMR